MDTGFVVARFSSRDQYHEAARSLADALTGSQETWTTDAVLLEVAAAFSDPPQRALAMRMWDRFHSGMPQYRSAPAAGATLDEAVELFRSRPDKSWSLTDCLSFVVMRREDLIEALSADQHFVQAGFRALLIEPPVG